MYKTTVKDFLDLTDEQNDEIELRVSNEIRKQKNKEKKKQKLIEEKENNKKG